MSGLVLQGRGTLTTQGHWPSGRRGEEGQNQGTLIGAKTELFPGEWTKIMKLLATFSTQMAEYLIKNKA